MESVMSNQEMRSAYQDVADLRLHYHEIGEGPAIIMLHGGGPGSSGLSNYKRNYTAFADRHRVIMLDLPGYGLSSKPRITEPLWGFMARAVAGFIDSLGLGSAHLIGNSLGGGTTLKLALSYPEKVGKFVLMGPAGGDVTTTGPTPGIKKIFTFYHPPGPSLEKLRGFVSELVYDPNDLPDEVLKERLEASLLPGAAENFPLLLRPEGPPKAEELWRDRLDEIPHPALIVWGREDKVNPLAQGEVLWRNIPNARLLVLPKCGHWAQWEKADEFNRAVRDFLDHAV